MEMRCAGDGMKSFEGEVNRARNPRVVMSAYVGPDSAQSVLILWGCPRRDAK
jgi:hypothetical protein